MKTLKLLATTHTRNECGVGYPIICTDNTFNAILIIDTTIMCGTTISIRLLQRHVLRSFLAMFQSNLWKCRESSVQRIYKL